jgi:hypothetical protein
MKQSWEAAEKAIVIFQEELEELYTLLPKSVKIHQQLSRLNKSWKKVKLTLNEMDKFITPVKSVEVKSKMLDNEPFRQAWILWKEYLHEQHGIFMRSRAELMGLKRMMDISGDNPEKAIFYLEYSMSRLEKAFYKVNEAEEPKFIKKDSKPFVLKIPAQFKTQTVDKFAGLTD